MSQFNGKITKIYGNYETEDDHSGKKIKLKHHIICDRLNEQFPDIGKNKHEIQKFPLVFQELITLSNLDEEFSDSEDGITNLLDPSNTNWKSAQ